MADGWVLPNIRQSFIMFNWQNWSLEIASGSVGRAVSKAAEETLVWFYGISLGFSSVSIQPPHKKDLQKKGAESGTFPTKHSHFKSLKICKSTILN